MVGNERINGVDGATDVFGRNALVRARVAEALQDSDLSAVFDIEGVDGNPERAGAALKTVLAQKIADCAIRAMDEAKKRKLQLGAAAVVIAAKEG